MQQLKQTVLKAVYFSEKSRREGLLSIENDVDKMGSDSGGFFKLGMKLALDGIDSWLIENILNNIIGYEKDEKEKRLKLIQKEAVLCIQTGYNSRILCLKLFSFLNRNESKILERLVLKDDLDLDDLSDNEVIKQPPEPNTKINHSEFINQAAIVIKKAYDFSCKARREGLLALEDELEDLDDELMKEGLRLVVDGTDSAIINNIISNMISMEKNEMRRRLNTIIKSTVLGIQQGDNPEFHAHKLISHLDNSELKAAAKFLLEMDFFKENKFEELNPLKDGGKKFTAYAASIAHRAYKFSDKSGKDGLKSLKEKIDLSKAAERDIFEYGMLFAIEETDAYDINLILSNLINLEPNEEIKRLKTMQKRAVLGICNNENPQALFHVLLSYVNDEELEKINKIFSDTKFAYDFNKLLNLSCDDARAIAREEDEKLIGSREVIDFFSKPYDLVKDAEFIKREHPQTAAYLLACLSSGGCSAGGIETIVDILKLTDRSAGKKIIKKWKENDPELAEEVKRRMFSFEDIVLLDDRSLQMVFREVDSQDLAIALKGADDKVNNKIFRNMSRRAGSMLREDMDYMGPVRISDVNRARREIVSIIINLDDDGKIVINRGEKN